MFLEYRNPFNDVLFLIFMTDTKPDELSYSVSDDGWSRLTVIRDTSDVRAGGRLEVHSCCSDTSFTRTLLRLIDYHNECVDARSKGEEFVLQGASCAESGVTVDRRLRSWDYDERSMALYLDDKKLLRAVAEMHNQVVDSYRVRELPTKV